RSPPATFFPYTTLFRSLDQLGEHAAQGLDAERERGHVEEEDVLHLALQHRALDAGADRHHLVGVDAPVRLLAEELLDARLDGWQDRKSTRLNSSHQIIS